MRFTKMQGLGNDYIYFDGFASDFKMPSNPGSLAPCLSDRHFGIGADGLIFMLPPADSRSDARMRMFNADGSESPMCGNGIRCVAKYLYDHGHVKKERMVVDTGRGPLTLDCQVKAGRVETVRVNMAEPILKATAIPTSLLGDPPVNVPVDFAGRKVTMTAVSMGNPHAVVFVDEATDEWVLGVGPQAEVHPAFPLRANIEFVEVLSRSEVRMRVWERGSGETWACGTGACAVVVAGVLTGRTDRNVLVHLRGGDLQIEWSAADNCVYMTGPATEVFTGEIELAQEDVG